jgi:type VI secretion system VasI family protein
VNKILAVAAAVCVLAGPCHAASGGDDLRTQLARCAAIQDALNRLECFDLLTRSMGLASQGAAQAAGATSAAPPARPVPMPPIANPAVGTAAPASPVPESTTAQVSGWNVVIKRDDKGRVHSVTLQTQAAQGVGVRGAPVSLALRCMDTETTAFIDWQSYVGGDSVPVTVSVGGGGDSRSNWRISPDGTLTYYPGKAVDFVRSLLNAGQLAARVNPYGGHEISATFDLSGLDTAVQPLRQACHW